MHAFNWGQEPRCWSFFHDGDYGDVLIATPVGQELRVPAASLIAFAAEFVRCKRIQELETATDREIFGLKAKS